MSIKQEQKHPNISHILYTIPSPAEYLLMVISIDRSHKDTVLT